MGQDLLERQPPVEAAGQGLSKDKGGFWRTDRRTGQTLWCLYVCVSVREGVCDDVRVGALAQESFSCGFF